MESPSEKLNEAEPMYEVSMLKVAPWSLSIVLSRFGGAGPASTVMEDMLAFLGGKETIVQLKLRRLP